MKGLVVDLGHRSYLAAYQIQVEIAGRVKGGEIPHVLLFVEHDPVLTLGAGFHEENLLFTRDEYRARGIDVRRTDRGGDVTFHGPRQLVIYPIFDVAQLGRDLHQWLRQLEQTIIEALDEIGLKGYRFPPHTGVWSQGEKVAAIGIKVSRWVSLHGIALNCDNDLSPFGMIVPCGIRGHGVTSLTKLTGRQVTIEEAKPMVVRAFEHVFSLTLEPGDLTEITSESSQTATPQASS